MELPGRAVACSPESHGIHGAPGGAGARTASEFVRDAWSWFHGAFSPNSKLREYVVPQKPIAEQENPKPKAYSRRGRRRIEKCEKCGGPAERRPAERGRAALGWCLNSMAESPYFSAINARLNQLKGTDGNLLESGHFS